MFKNKKKFYLLIKYNIEIWPSSNFILASGGWKLTKNTIFFLNFCAMFKLNFNSIPKTY